VSTARHCDGPRCEHWAITDDITERGFLEVTVIGDSQPFDFCSWDCAMRYAATLQPSMEVPA
jgi:hypothetical protein